MVSVFDMFFSTHRSLITGIPAVPISHVVAKSAIFNHVFWSTILTPHSSPAALIAHINLMAVGFHTKSTHGKTITPATSNAAWSAL